MQRAISVIASKGKQVHAATRIRVQIHCRVKPNVSSGRQGIAVLDEDRVEVCVAKPAQDGEANRAVLKVLGCL